MIMRNSTWLGRHQVHAVMHGQAQLRASRSVLCGLLAGLMKLNRLQFKKWRACAHLRASGVVQGAGPPRG